ncbi:MAG TPA: hypothetical protein VGM30_24915 [Puia sp.]|jgi:hypothetical protein
MDLSPLDIQRLLHISKDVETLNLHFRVLEIAEKTGFDKILVKNFLKGEQRITKAFYQKFYETFFPNGRPKVLIKSTDPTITPLPESMNCAVLKESELILKQNEILLRQNLQMFTICERLTLLLERIQLADPEG